MSREWGPFPKPEPSVRLAGAAMVGMALGVVAGSMMSRAWSVTMAVGVGGAVAASLAMVLRLALEARHKRTHRCVVRREHSNIVAIRRDSAA